MKVYISSHCQLAARYVAFRLAEYDIDVISMWIFREEKPAEEEKPRAMNQNIKEIAESDVLVLIASSGMVPGGKFVEAGAAIGMGKPVYVLGRRENMLLHHPFVLQFDKVDSLVEKLSSMK